MANNLKDHLKEVADAIRAKKGTNDLINPQDFATEIEGISGSGGESGEEEWNYYLLDWESVSNDAAYDKTTAATIVKSFDNYFNTQYAVEFSENLVLPGGLVIAFDAENWCIGKYKGMRWCTTRDVERLLGFELTPKSYLEMMQEETPFARVLASQMTECTKEEFYALTNA